MARVLVVDDEKGMRFTLNEFLTQQNHVVYAAREGNEALELAREIELDVALVDIILPGMDGVELLGELKKLQEDLQIILMSGEPTVDTAIRAMRAGAFDFLSKPVPLNAIQRIVGQAMQVKSLKDENKRLWRENERHRENLEEMIRERTQQLRDSEQRFRQFFEAGLEGLLFHDQGRILDANSSLLNMFGYEATPGIVGTGVLNLLAGETDTEVLKQIDAELKEPTGKILEALGQQREGRQFNIEISSHPFPTKDDVTGVVVVRDITLRKTAQHALGESEQKLDLITRNMNDMVSLADNNLRFVYVSPSHTLHLGYAEEELLGKSVFEYLCPEDLETVTDKLTESMLTNEARHADYRFRHKDGHLVWIRTSGGFIQDESGRRVGAVFSSQDITEYRRTEMALRQSEERYRTITETSKDIIWYYDLAKRHFSFTSKAVTDLLGYSLEEVEGYTLVDILTHDSAKMATAALNDLIADNSPEKQVLIQAEHIHKDGHLVWLEVSGSLILDEQDQPIAVAGISRDITERREKERLKNRLRETQKMEALARLADGVAYDFSGLLGAIDERLQRLLLDRPDDAELKQTVQGILDLTQRGGDLTHRLLTISRKQRIEMQPVSVNSMLDDLTGVVCQVLGEKIQLQQTLAEDLATISADPAQLEQVILTLALRARADMEEGGRFFIQTTQVFLEENVNWENPAMKSGDYVTIVLSDTGRGLDDEQKTHVFEPFFEQSPETGQTGLGLAMVYGIVRQHGGMIHVYSEPDKGTTFRLYFPTVSANEQGIQQNEKQLPLPTGKETILLVEDDSSLRELMKQTLQGLGYTVIESSSAEQALQKSEEAALAIDLMVTDLVLPGLDGQGLTREMLLRRPNLAVLLISGYSQELVLYHGMLTQRTQFLSKPFSPRTLAFKIRQILDDGNDVAEERLS